MKSLVTIFQLTFSITVSLIVISCNNNQEVAEYVPTPSANAKLDEAFVLASGIGNLKSLVVSQNGSIIKEAFYNSTNANEPHDVRSVTKSVIGLLIGMAIEKGFIQSIDQPIGSFIRPLVENLSEEKSNIKIRHLLTMSSGFEWDELIRVDGYNNWISSANQIQYLLDRPLVYQPGRTFTYNSAAFHLLSVIITQATEMNTLAFAKQYLFTPLGIGDRNWQVDKQGYHNGGAGLKITPHDMVKIGQLILNRGEYNGKRIISQQWIDETISSKISTNNSMAFGPNYGFCWWTGSNQKGNYVFANGWGGQFIVVVPSMKLVVVATNQWSGVTSSVANDQWYKTMDLILSRVLTAFS